MRLRDSDTFEWSLRCVHAFLAHLNGVYEAFTRFWQGVTELVARLLDSGTFEWSLRGVYAILAENANARAAVTARPRPRRRTSARHLRYPGTGTPPRWATTESARTL